MRTYLTLNRAWKYCLAQWAWMIEQRRQHPRRFVSVLELKEQWLEANSFLREDIAAACFFCEYNIRHGEVGNCSACPGKLIDPFFNCWCPTYSFMDNPEGFNKKLLELNARRLYCEVPKKTQVPTEKKKKAIQA